MSSLYPANDSGFPKLLQYLIGRESVAAAVVPEVGVFQVHQMPKGPILALIENFGSVAITFSMQRSASNFLPATGSILLTEQPTDTDTLTISDGSGAKVFEFVAPGGTPSGTNTAVTIGATLGVTIANLVIALQAMTWAGVGITSSIGPNGDIKLKNNASGTAGNVAITKLDAGSVMVVAGMSGGVASTTVTMRAAGADVTSLVVAPGARAVFAIEGTPTDGEFFRMVTALSTAYGRITLFNFYGSLLRVGPVGVAV